jgi:Mycothiol maleylpyruvate isomerase N-terminal domain
MVVPMDPAPPDIEPMLAALRSAHQRVSQLFARRSDDWLLAPSALPEWSRLTIACHLRYVAEAMLRVTDAAERGEVARMYPNGRNLDRPPSLAPRQSEAVADVVESLRATSEALEARWFGLPNDMWTQEFTEADHGTLLFSRWLALRLTEVEVHGTDVGAHDGPDCNQWSASFVGLLLPLRIAWLTRARERPDADVSVGGIWTLESTTQQWRVSSSVGSRVVNFEADESLDSGTVLRGEDRILLALLLGRDTAHVTDIVGPGVAQFKAAFPGP